MHAHVHTHENMHIRAHMHVHTCTCTHACMHTHTCGCKHMDTHARTRAHMHIYTCTHANMHAHTHAHIHACTHACMHMHTHTTMQRSGWCQYSLLSTYSGHRNNLLPSKGTFNVEISNMRFHYDGHTISTPIAVVKTCANHYTIGSIFVLCCHTFLFRSYTSLSILSIPLTPTWLLTFHHSTTTSIAHSYSVIPPLETIKRISQENI